MEEVLGQCCTDDRRCSLCCPVGCRALEMWLVWLKNWMLNFVSFKKNLRFKQLVWLLATILESANLECLTFRQPDLQTGESGSWYGNQELSRQSRLWNIWSSHPTPPCAHRSWKGVCHCVQWYLIFIASPGWSLLRCYLKALDEKTFLCVCSLIINFRCSWLLFPEIENLPWQPPSVTCTHGWSERRLRCHWEKGCQSLV